MDQETADAVGKLDEQYTLANDEACPQLLNRTRSISETSGDQCEMELDADTIAQAESRFTSKLTDLLPPPPEVPPATTNTSDVPNQPEQSPEIIPSPRLSFQHLPSSEQQTLIASFTAALPPSFNHATSSRYVVTLHTHTKCITRAIRTALFNLPRSSEYGYVNPLGTVVCRTERDFLERQIYVPTEGLAGYMQAFFNDPGRQKKHAILGPVTCRENEQYKPP